MFFSFALRYFNVNDYRLCLIKVNVVRSGWMLEVWQTYISMELLLGNLKEARTLYKRCYSRRLEGQGTEVRRSW